MKKDAGQHEKDCQNCDQNYQEIELKLKLHDLQLVEKILKDPVVVNLSQNAQPRVKDYETTYYDTQDQLFLKHRVCYRIRNSAGEYTATIKGFGSSQGGLSLRSEWNQPLTEKVPSLEPFRELDIGQELEKLIKTDEILPVFLTRFKRTALDLFCEEGSVIELALDLGEIEAGEQREPICELELELKKGQVEEIVKLGQRLTEVYQLKPEEKSKFQRGLRLTGLTSDSSH